MSVLPEQLKEVGCIKCLLECFLESVAQINLFHETAILMAFCSESLRMNSVYKSFILAFQK